MSFLAWVGLVLIGLAGLALAYWLTKHANELGYMQRFKRWRSVCSEKQTSGKSQAWVPPAQPNSNQGASGHSAVPPASKATGWKPAREVFAGAFPGVKVPPAGLPPVDFAMRAELCRIPASETGKAKWELRIDVMGSITVAEPCDLDLVVSLEDLTEGPARPVFSGLERYQDERTGMFRLRTSLGALKPPGRPDSGWTTVGTIPLDVLQAPRSGRRQLRLACLGIPGAVSRLSLVDPELIAHRICSASVTMEAELSLIGYVEQRDARLMGAGLVVSLAWALADEEAWELALVLPIVRAWIDRHVAFSQADFPGESAKLKEAMEQSLALSERTSLGLDVVSHQLARVPVAELHYACLRLCIVAGKAAGSFPFKRLVEIARALEVPMERLNQLFSEHETAADFAALEQELGLSPVWPTDRIRRHLREQFSKWNAQSLFAKSEEQRVKIQRKLDAVARLQQRYA